MARIRGQLTSIGQPVAGAALVHTARELLGSEGWAQFSQIANVLQTGGESGMWNFDRYQRWVAQKERLGDAGRRRARGGGTRGTRTA